MTAKSQTKIVALTGATGFVGAYILNRLLGLPDVRVNALTRRPQEPREGVTWIPGSLNERAALEALAEGADAVVHCAGLVKARTCQEFEAVNKEGTGRVAEAAAGAGTNPHFVLVSSLAAREPHLSYYAGSKRAGEDLVRTQQGLDHWTIIRPPAVYGPGDTEILKWLRSMRSGFALAPGSLENRFSLIHAADVAGAVAGVLWREATHGKTYELDDGQAEGYAMADIASIVGPLLERRVRCLAIPRAAISTFGLLNEVTAAMTGGVPMLSRAKAREVTHPDWTSRGDRLQELGVWKPTIPATKGLTETVRWYQDQGLL